MTLTNEEKMGETPSLTPIDSHDRRLLENVHPSDWTNPEPKGRYQLVVIGAGTAGLVTAAGAAGLGAKVALIEKHLMGGDCLNVGCVPSKALIRSARAAADARDAARFGVEVGSEVRVDFPAVMERMRRLRSQISPNDSAKRFRELGVDVYLGGGRFVAPGQIEVGGQRLEYSRAVIATGARAAAPPIPGLREVGYLTNETVFSLTELPRRLAIIGGGPIGCEMAQAFARFGSKVTLIEAGPQVLMREDRDAAAIVEKALQRDGVALFYDTKLTGVRVEGESKMLELEREARQESIAVDAILVAVGRAPNTEGLGLESVGVEYDRTGVQVDERLRTTSSRIYAAGDICWKYKFTHTADFLARIVIQNALFFGRSKATALTVPWCTYTDPEIAHVGMYAHEAEAQGLDVHTIEVGLEDVDRAILEGEEEGLLKVHLKRGSDRILGATLVARHAGEMISEITLAMVSGAGLGTIAKTIHPYPTVAEALRKAGDAYNRTRLTPFAEKVLGLLLRLRG